MLAFSAPDSEMTSRNGRSGILAIRSAMVVRPCIPRSAARISERVSASNLSASVLRSWPCSREWSLPESATGPFPNALKWCSRQPVRETGVRPVYLGVISPFSPNFMHLGSPARSLTFACLKGNQIFGA